MMRLEHLVSTALSHIIKGLRSSTYTLRSYVGYGALTEQEKRIFLRRFGRYSDALVSHTDVNAEEIKTVYDRYKKDPLFRDLAGKALETYLFSKKEKKC